MIKTEINPIPEHKDMYMCTFSHPKFGEIKGALEKSVLRMLIEDIDNSIL